MEDRSGKINCEKEPWDFGLKEYLDPAISLPKAEDIFDRVIEVSAAKVKKSGDVNPYRARSLEPLSVQVSITDAYRE